MPVPGDTLVSRTSLIDGGGAPITGASFTLVGYDPAGSPLFPSAPTELGNGVYEFAVPTLLSDPIGEYYLQATSDSVPSQVKEFQWTVKPLGTPDRWNPGDVAMDFITVIDPVGLPVLGETFTTVGYNTVGKIIPVPAPVEIGNGVYRVAITTSRFDPPGSYYISLRSSTFPNQVYEVEFTTGQPTNLVGGVTLRDLRRQVMAMFGDIISCSATQMSDGGTFTDEDNLVGEPGSFAGREVLFLTGANAGQRRKVVGSSRDASLLAFSRPLPYPVAVGDECDITNAYGIGITFQSIDNAIRYAITTARPRAHVAVSYRVDDWEGTAIPIPVDVVGINDVYAIDSNERQRHVRRGQSRVNGWMIDHPSRTIILQGYEGIQPRGMSIVVNARVLPNLLLEDDDVTMLDAEWLIKTATSHLCLDTMLSRQVSGDWGSKGMLYKQDAEKLVSRLTPNIGPNYQVVRHG